MKSILVLFTLAIVASGCSKQSNEHPASDTVSPSPMQGGEMAGHGDSTTMSGGMMMSGDVEKDMPMMNDMMVRDLRKGDALYDHRFIDMMIPHHEGAIMMAKDAQQKAHRPELMKLAESIIKGQRKEIGQMKEWRTNWYGENAPNGMANADEMMKHMAMMNDMIIKKLGQKDADYEGRFIDMMIAHHEGAIKMAEDAQSKATHPEIKRMAQNIIGAQKKDITQMEGWRKQWYGR